MPCRIDRDTIGRCGVFSPASTEVLPTNALFAVIDRLREKVARIETPYRSLVVTFLSLRTMSQAL